VHRRLLCALLALSCALAALGGGGSLHADDEPEFRGRRLAEVLQELRDRGLDLVFSSAVVAPDLRVRVEPSASDPRAILDEILPPLGLKAEDGPSGAILILPADPDPADPQGRATAKEARRSLFMTEVIVTPSRHSMVAEEQASRRTVTHEEAVLAPTIGGDITRVVELLPGVAAPDNSAAFHIRGGAARDASLVLDNLELYDPYHLQSFLSPYSLIDNNVADRIDFFGGGFTADYGDRHGGFVDIATQVPGERHAGQLEIGTLNSRATYQAPMKRGSGSWLVSARAWYPEALLNTTEMGSGENINPRFADLYGKAAFDVAPRHRLSLHGLLAFDSLQFSETDGDSNQGVDAPTRSGYLWLQALSGWSESLVSETMLSGGRIDRRRDGWVEDEEPILVQDDRVVDFFGLKHDSTWEISDTHGLKSGADVRRLNAEYRYSDDRPADPPSSRMYRLDPDGTSLGVYAAWRARATPQLFTELGMRWDRQTYTNDNQVSPRFNLLWNPNERWEARLALGRFHQSQRIHELQVEDGETDFHTAEVSEQVELSVQRLFASGLRVRLDAYEKRLTNLRPRYENLFEPIELFPETSQDRVRVAPEEARLRGIELMVRGPSDRRFFWWVSYTLSEAMDRIDGEEVPRSWDQTHAGRFLIGYRREDRWSISFTGSVHTGWPTTPVTAEVETCPAERPKSY